MKREDCLKFRRAFEPQSVKLALIAESPPQSRLYFDNPDGPVTEPLFTALMQQFGYLPKTKLDGLREFQLRGWILVDATYEPVNGLDKETRDAVISGDYHLLRRDLSALLPDRAVPLVLIKANVCRLLENRLRNDGFNVLNAGRVVYFPDTGGQKQFERQFGAILVSSPHASRLNRNLIPSFSR